MTQSLATAFSRSLLVACLGSSAFGCGSGSEVDAFFEPSEEGLEQRDIPSFEEYKSWAKLDGKGFVIEGDIPLRDEAELRAHYDLQFGSDQPKSAVALTVTDGSNTICFGRHGTYCVDDKFWNGQQRDLTYCVDNDFGVYKPNIIAAMAAAGDAWKAPTVWASTSHIKLRYVSTHDATCKISSPKPSSVYFKVSRRISSTDSWGACSFFPRSSRTCDGLDGRTIAFNTAAYELSSYTEVMTHEVGHALGLAHEFQRIDAFTPDGCSKTNQLRYLTPVDPSSIMAYRWSATGCNLNRAGYVTQQDIVGIRTLYGIPVPWHVPTSLAMVFSG